MKYPLKTIIVDDMRDHINSLSRLLEPYKSVISIHHKAETFDEARSILLDSSEPYDLSFLDIELDNNTDCWELIEAVGVRQFGIIVFSTRFDRGNYLYLSKPYSSKKVAELIPILKDEAQERNNLEAQIGFLPKLPIPQKGKTHFISQEDVIYIYVKGNQTTIHYLEDGQVKEMLGTGGASLSEYERQLHQKLFWRLDANHLVNVKYLHSTEPGSVKIKIKGQKDINLLLREGKKKTLLSVFLKIRGKKEKD